MCCFVTLYPCIDNRSVSPSSRVYTMLLPDAATSGWAELSVRPSSVVEKEERPLAHKLHRVLAEELLVEARCGG